MTDDRASRIKRLMAAAYDSPGARIRDGELSLHLGKKCINPVFARMLAESRKD